MKNRQLLMLLIMVSVMILTGCSVSNHSMKTPNYHIEFYKTDFEYSPQVQAEATSVRVLGIDWKRLLNWQSGDLDSDRFNLTEEERTVLTGNIVTDAFVGTLTTVIPVIGDYGKGKVNSFALYNLMQENPGYDVVIYPQYETQKFIVPLFYSKRNVKVTARLGRIK